MTKFKCVWLEFPCGNRFFGGGGWSRRAKHRPAPERREITTTDVVFTTGKSVLISGIRKLKVNIFKAATGEIVRADYPLEGLTGCGPTTRQLASRAAARTRGARKIITANAATTAAAIDAMINTPVRLALPGITPRSIQDWAATGCQHPVSPEIMELKMKSGVGWAEFARLAKGASL
jgi:hypothetical protein